MLTRRRFLTTSALTAAATGAAATAMALADGKGAGRARPNVLFIVVDDLNDWPSPCGGYPGIITPNFERLAACGVTFRQAYCPAPICNASRAAMLTGVRPSSSGIYSNDPPWQTRLPNAVTLPEAFGRQGWRTAAVGKVFHGYFRYPPFSQPATSARWEAAGEKPGVWGNYSPYPDDPLPPHRPVNGLVLDGANFDWGPWPSRKEESPDWHTVRFVEDFLAESQPAPFFLGAGLYRPHLPWYVPQRFYDLYPLDRITLPETRADDLDDLPPVGRSMAAIQIHKKIVDADQWKKAIQAYLACITFADHCLGALLDALDRSPHADNTIIALWSDHGWHLGEKQHWRKFTLWERATHAPFIMAGPGIARGAVCDQPVELLGLYPTLTELAGVPLPPGPEGRSLVPLLKNPGQDWPYPAVTTWLKGNHAVRFGPWRYIRYHDGGEELYDHRSDPNEFTNLASDPQFAATIAQLRAYLPGCTP